MTASQSRYALYFVPRAGTGWSRFGDCALSGEARRYGFHATLKAPFHLAEGTRLEQMQAKLSDFCGRLTGFAIPRLQLATLDGFIALVPSAKEPRIDAIAASCVTEFDCFRAPPDAAELARRRKRPLSARQDACLERWGYPYVLEEFRFHFSLTDRAGNAGLPALPCPPSDPLMFDAICLVEEPAPGADFRLMDRYGFAARGRLLYVVGPSGAGKDSVLEWVRAHLPGGAPVAFAQRTITRAAQARGEANRRVSAMQFEAERAQGRFAMHWRANGHAYGIGREVRDWLAQGLTVVVNGSRAHLPHAIADFPALEVVHVTAAREALRRRLQARGRETHEQIQHRIERGEALRLPAAIPCIEIRNDAELGEAGRALLGCLLERA